MVPEIVGINPFLMLMPSICQADITSIENARLQPNSIYLMQIAKADVIVFSKSDLLTDLATQKHLIAIFKSLFPDK